MKWRIETGQRPWFKWFAKWSWDEYGYKGFTIQIFYKLWIVTTEKVPW
jgi:hypothetical protein